MEKRVYKMTYAPVAGGGAGVDFGFESNGRYLEFI
jgi:hypothetical protein